MSSGNHWYRVEGDTITTAHDSTLREARKQGLYISPTSILKAVRANPALDRWMFKETVKACDMYPRFANEDIDVYSGRVKKLSGKIGEEAAKKGIDIHAVLENYPQPCMNPEMVGWWDSFDGWYKDNIRQTYHNEIRLADRDIGVAGTCDLVAEHKEYGLCVADYKTKRKMDGDIWYWSYAQQLAFYAKAYQKKHGLAETPACISVAIDSMDPSMPPIYYLWTKEEIEEAHTDFLCAAWSFFRDKNYWPVGKWAPVFAFNGQSNAA